MVAWVTGVGRVMEFTKETKAKGGIGGDSDSIGEMVETVRGALEVAFDGAGVGVEGVRSVTSTDGGGDGGVRGGVGGEGEARVTEGGVGGGVGDGWEW